MGDPEPDRARPGSRPGLARTLAEIGGALSLTLGRRQVARMVVDRASLTRGDKVADIGCGPGIAVREAVRRGASATGVDPSGAALRIASLATPARMAASAAWVAGSAEAIPLAGGTATVAWAISSLHHWSDHAAGLAEVHRVLGDGGRALVAERLVKPGARGLAAHGLTERQAAELAGQLGAAGFVEVHSEVLRAGRRTMVLIGARKAQAA